MSDRDYKQEYENYWKEIVETDGVLNKDQIMRELSDYSFIIGEVSKVYSNITGAKLSKPTYFAIVVISEAERHTNELIEECVEERTETLKAERDALREALEKLEAISEAEKYFIKHGKQVCKFQINNYKHHNKMPFTLMPWEMDVAAKHLGVIGGNFEREVKNQAYEEMQKLVKRTGVSGQVGKRVFKAQGEQDD